MRRNDAKLTSSQERVTMSFQHEKREREKKKTAELGRGSLPAKVTINRSLYLK